MMARPKHLPDEIARLVMLARFQGVPYDVIAHDLMEHHDFAILSESLRQFVSRRIGRVRRRLVPRWRPPEGYRAEYLKLRNFFGAVKARHEIELLVARDQRRAA